MERGSLKDMIYKVWILIIWIQLELMDRDHNYQNKQPIKKSYEDKYGKLAVPYSKALPERDIQRYGQQILQVSHHLHLTIMIKILDLGTGISQEYRISIPSPPHRKYLLQQGLGYCVRHLSIFFDNNLSTLTSLHSQFERLREFIVGSYATLLSPIQKYGNIPFYSNYNSSLIIVLRIILWILPIIHSILKWFALDMFYLKWPRGNRFIRDLGCHHYKRYAKPKRINISLLQSLEYV